MNRQTIFSIFGAALLGLASMACGDGNTDPDDDSGDGYTVGSLWIDVTADTVWRCVDATLTLAIWLVLATRTSVYYTGGVTTGTTHHIADADISRNDGAIIKDDGNSGIAIAHWYRLGTYNLVYGAGLGAASGNWEFRGTTFSAGAGDFSWFVEGNSAGHRLAVKNDIGFTRGFYVWPFNSAGNLA